MPAKKRLQLQLQKGGLSAIAENTQARAETPSNSTNIIATTCMSSIVGTPAKSGTQQQQGWYQELLQNHAGTKAISGTTALKGTPVIWVKRVGKEGYSSRTLETANRTPSKEDCVAEFYNCEAEI
jgi:hypothetical protein